jgi:hypothetical protein
MDGVIDLLGRSLDRSRKPPQTPPVSVKTKCAEFPFPLVEFRCLEKVTFKRL